MSNYTKTTDFEAKDSLPTGDSGKIIRGAEFETEFDAISTAIATKADTAGPTFTGTLTFETISDGTISIAAFVDEDDMVSDSATLVPTQQSVKAYVDSQVTAQDLDFQADSGGALSIDLDTETMTFTGGTGIDTSGSGNAVTFAIDSTVTTLTGTQTLTNKTLTSPDVNTPDIDGGTIDGTVIGGTTAAAGSFTTVSATGNITVDGTVDGRDVATDGTKLDGIEASADVTDTANVTAAGALMDSELTSEASVKALDQGVATTDSPTFAGLDVGGTIEFDGLSGTGAVSVTNILDEDNMASDSATALATQQSIKAYVDSQVAGADTLAEVLGNGNTTGGTDIAVGTGDDITFADSSKAIFGAGSDLQIFHDGSHSYITDTGTGDLRINGASNVDIRDTTGVKMFRGVSGGEAILYYNNDQKLATTSSGVDITGTITTDGLTVDGTGQITRLGLGVAAHASAGLNITTSGSDQHIRLNNGSELGIMYLDSDGELNIWAHGDGEVINLRTGSGAGTDIVQVDNTGIDVTGTVTSDGLTVDVTVDSDSIATITSSATANNTELRLGTSGNDAVISGTGGSSGALAFKTYGTERLRIDSSGNVGIGTSSPSVRLDTRLGTTTGKVAEFHNSAGYGIGFTVEGDGGVNTINSESNQALAFATNGASNERMRIDSSGNVIAGHTSALGSAANRGNITINGSSDAILSLGNSGSLKGYILQDSGGMTVYSDGATYQRFYTNGSERLRIDSSGNVGIGTSSPAYKLQVNGSGTVARFTDGTSHMDFYAGSNLNEIATASPLLLSVGGTERMRIDSSGNAIFTKSGGAYLQLKDASAVRGAINVTTSDGLVFTTGSSFTERMRIDSSGNLLVGKTSSSITTAGTTITSSSLAQSVSDTSTNLATNGGAVLNLCNTSATDGNFSNIGGYNSNGLVVSQMNFINVNHTSRTGAITLSTHNGTSLNEAMRIDSSGNVLIGMTNDTPGLGDTDTGASFRADGASFVSRTLSDTSGSTFYVNRNTNDGNLIQLQKDGTTIGSIGVESSGLLIGSGNVGVRFIDSGQDRVIPRKTTLANADAAIDLGDSGSRFKDLYLSGGVYVGGTGSANYLDDYEEGTFTATLKGGTSEPATLVTATGYYTKIGRAVTYNISFENKDTTGYSGSVSVTGLPFANGFGRHTAAAGVYNLASWAGFVIGVSGQATSQIDLMDIRSASAWASTTHSAGATRYMWLSGTYMTTA